ncbi:MAG: minor capsid protein, partial [Oscillospiraceae bacterium]|nr:minor capsid protein [Oscillospiraceae bacterium]
MRDRLEDALCQSYYRTVYDTQREAGAYYDFNLLSDNQIKAALAANWSGKNWSERIWDNNQAFANAVQDTVTLGLMTGQRYDEIRDNLLYTIGMDSTAGARYRAARLVRTECNYIANQGHLMGYRAAGLEQYIFLATLDLRTSEICRSLDGRRFDLAQAQAGTNLPPMHPNCRSTTIPADAAQLLSKIKRAARNPVTGKSVQVPGDMTYREWYEQYVSGNEQALANEKRIQQDKRVEKFGKSDTIKPSGILSELTENPERLAFYEPGLLKSKLEDDGFEVKPLSRGKFKGISFEDGGGYKFNFSEAGLLQFHPESRSHHGGAYH